MRGKQLALWIVILSMCIGLTASSAVAGPVIAAPVDKYDFGKVAEGTEVVHDFIIKNTGDAELEITQVKTG